MKAYLSFFRMPFAADQLLHHLPGIPVGLADACIKNGHGQAVGIPIIFIGKCDISKII